MNLQLDLTPELEAKLRDRARAAGEDPKVFALHALAEKLRGPETLAEILAPVHREFKESGMSEEELRLLSERALADSRRSKRNGT